MLQTHLNMKQFLVIQKHSFIDVITNSSTELFVCDTDKSLEMVETILEDITSGYAKPFIYTQEMYDERSSDEYKWGYEVEENIGKVIIKSIGDNSIPYNDWEKINTIFDARSYHLG